jgi:hypothetical protein
VGAPKPIQITILQAHLGARNRGTTVGAQ